MVTYTFAELHSLSVKDLETIDEEMNAKLVEHENKRLGKIAGILWKQDRLAGDSV